jgi:hypothetical protein
MKQKINYIKQLQWAQEKIMDDDTLTAHHIALYYAIFYMWNRASFAMQLSVSRSELMLLSKIGSANTYTQAMKQLDFAGLIRYFPSNNPLKGSIVTCITFDNSTDTTTHTTTDNSSGMSTDNSTATLYKPIKPINNKNIETGKGKINPPARDVFHLFAKSLNIDYENLKETIDEKYSTWFKAGWKDGNGKDIIDWEQKFKNTLPYLKPMPTKQTKTIVKSSVFGKKEAKHE